MFLSMVGEFAVHSTLQAMDKTFYRFGMNLNRKRM